MSRRADSRKPVRAARLPLGEEEVRPTFRRERSAMRRGVWPVAGCDEAGRGPLAGPVVAAAVILDPQRVPRGLDDSKKLSAPAREALYDKICASAHVAVAMAPPARIDRDNILRASLWALARAVAALPVPPRLVLVDGRGHNRSGQRSAASLVAAGNRPDAALDQRALAPKARWRHRDDAFRQFCWSFA